MPTPSLILVPARFKTGKLYTPVATTTGALELGASGDFNVTRATTATRVNASGLIESVASGIPRLDYYTSGGVTGCPALLVEPAGTNLCRYSEQFNTVTSGWDVINLLTITGNTNATLDPAGGNTADLIVATTGNVGHSLFNATNNLGNIASGTVLTWSVFAKATNAASGFVQLVLGGLAFSPANSFANFQLSENGAITAGTYSAASIQSFGNGWYRCSITSTMAASGTPSVIVSPILASGTGRSAAFAGNGIDGVYLWGAQVETGSVATSYIPTTTAAVTRNADVISVSGAVSGCVGQTEGTIYVDMIPPTGGTGVNAFLIGDGTSNNFVLLGRSGATLRGSIRANNSFILNDLTLSLGQTAIKAALAYKSGDYSLYANGSIVASGTTAFSFSSDMIGAGLTSNVDFTAPNITNRYNAYALYTTRLTNQELAALTT